MIAIRRSRKGFTLVELLVVIVVLAVLAAIVLPKFVGSATRSKEPALKSDLKLLRNAITLFNNDTGAYPATLAALAATTAPAAGFASDGSSKSITAGDWHGPYLEAVPTDPVSGVAFTYGTTPPDVGKVTSSASGGASDGTAYSSW
jgi:general secretion pathway protein G